MDIVCCTDEKFIMPTGIMLKSLCHNNREIYVHIVIDDSVTESSKKSLETIVKSNQSNDIFFYLIDGSLFYDFPSVNVVLPRITKATYYRLLLANILPVRLNKVLFLDGDIIVRNNLTSLWESNVDQFAVGCVIDSEIDNIDMYNRLMYAPKYGYFNAGVLLINLLYWRKNNLTEKFFQFIKDFPERIKYHDQDVLNGVLYDQKLFLPIRYNVQTAFFFKKDIVKYDFQKYGKEIYEVRKDPYIVHFTTSFKPWNDDCTHPYRDLFLYYKNLTIWKDVPLKEEFYSNKTFRIILGDLLRLLRLKQPIRKKISKRFFE